MKGARGINWYNGEGFTVQADNQIRKKLMQEAGFSVDEKNDIYIKESYGAYMCSIPEKITTIEQLRNKEFQGKYNIVLALTEQGYKLVIGPGVPGIDRKIMGKGLYCENYKEIIERENKSKENDGDEGR